MTLLERLAALFCKPKTTAKSHVDVEEKTVAKIETSGRNMNYEDLLKVNGGLPYWWKWVNFTPKEIACKCSRCGGELWQGESNVPPEWFIEAMDALQRLRDKWGKPIVINSGHRCKQHNSEVGGVANSQHFTHIAFDCRCPFEKQQEFAQAAHDAGFRYVLTYPDRGFVHIDMRIGK